MLAAVCLCAVQAQAADPGWLYQAEVPVADQSAGARQAGGRAGLAMVLTRLTGLVALPPSTPVNQALANPDRYYTQFGYAAGPDGPRLVLQFSPPALLALMREASLPIWPTARPPLGLWLIVDDGGLARLADGSPEDPVGAAALMRARARGIDLTLAAPLAPAADEPELPPPAGAEEAAAAATPAAADAGAAGRMITLGEPDPRAIEIDAWLDAADFAALRAGSAPLDASILVVARLAPAGSGRWRAPVELHWPDAAQTGPAVGAPSGRGTPEPETTPVMTEGSAPAGASGVAPDLPAEPERFELESDTAEGLASAVVDALVERLLARYQVAAGGVETRAVAVAGLARAHDYGAVLQLFGRLEIIDDVAVVGVRGDRVEFALVTVAGLDQLQALLTRDGRLALDPGRPPGAALELRWQGP